MFFKLSCQVLCRVTLFASILLTSSLSAESQKYAATVGAKKITYQSVEQAAIKEIYETELKLYDVKMNQLKQLLIIEFVQLDPRSKSMSENDFLETYIVKPVFISEQQISDFAKSQPKLPAVLDDSLKKRVRDFLSKQEYAMQIEAWYAQQLKKHDVKIHLAKPSEPIYPVIIGDAPILGNKKAKVSIVEFSDFECPYCARGNVTLQKLKQQYGDKINIAYKHFPLSFHPNAQKAAEAGLCAQSQSNDYFWKLHDLMFEQQNQLSVGMLKDMAKSIGVDTEKFSKCLVSGEFAERVAADTKEGEALGINSTPAYFINGRLIQGALPIENFISKIDEILAKD